MSETFYSFITNAGNFLLFTSPLPGGFYHPATLYSLHFPFNKMRNKANKNKLTINVIYFS
jgi:hypothetical protein